MIFGDFMQGLPDYAGDDRVAHAALSKFSRSAWPLYRQVDAVYDELDRAMIESLGRADAAITRARKP